ncbi:MAG: bifunctional DNA primase/polymerase [Steroidobacteraceae bacterium]
MTAERTASVQAPAAGTRAIDLLRQGAFPDWWAFVPVAGKATYVKEWSTKPLSKELCIDAYKTNQAYAGLGVVTGEFSGGLIALDIDGSDADGRYKQAAGAEYAAYGEEQTMSWTSGKPGRRQLLYRVPPSVVPELRHVKTLILRGDGNWHLGHSDAERQGAKADIPAEGVEYQEVVLRFNQCQSVLPGSPHPETRKQYRWLNYNARQVAMAPDWVMDVLRGQRKPVQWLSDADQKALDAELGETAIPSRQIRGWFFKEEVQALLRPRLEDLIFNHPKFGEYGWKEREGNNPQRMSGCPWHGGRSGTSFQYSVESGCWDCKACGVGGDVLDFVHKVTVNDLYAERPQGPDLEGYVARIATELGFNYPEDARAQVTKTVETPRVVMDERQFHEALIKIHDEELNPAIRMGRMAGLAAETGRRLTGQQCLAAMDEYRYYEDSRRNNQKKEWWQDVEQMQFLVPNLLMRPTQVMMHAAGGLGKTSACMGLAKVVGRGESMRIRGIELPVKQGPVLWIQNDQNPAKLLRDCEDNGIDPAKDRWFIVKRGFQINHTHEFAQWIKEYKPALVVVDSIGSCSTKMQVEEKDKAFASPFYYYAEKNGDPADSGFPATSIIWIHHDNANGDARGTRYLIAAVDEQWHLRTLSEDEREALRERKHVPSSCRMIQIKKSRLGRQGDLLVVERDHDFAYSVWDYTPTERREDQGQGDPEPHTMALRIVKDHVLKARGEDGGRMKDRVTAKQVWETLVMEMNGQARRAPASRTVRRWLDRWVDDGVLALGKKAVVDGSDKPVQTYTLPSSRARALPMGDVLWSISPPKPLQTREKATDTANPAEYDVHCPEDGQPVQKSNGQQPEADGLSIGQIPVPEGDLGEKGANDTPTLGIRELHGLPEVVPGTPPEAPALAESPGKGDPLGAEVPGGEVPRGTSLGNEQPAPMDNGRSPDHPDVAEPGSGVQPGAGVALEAPAEYSETGEDWDNAFGTDAQFMNWG